MSIKVKKYLLKNLYLLSFICYEIYSLYSVEVLLGSHNTGQVLNGKL